MSGTVWALLVGIDDYGGDPGPLAGCVADVVALEDILQGRVERGRLEVQHLHDQDASRGRVIELFRSHLGRAGAGDVALFAFSGHGSIEDVDERLWFLEPTGTNQTLVLADSRHAWTGDLADKELNALIASVADRGAHVVVLLDCCHSGGATRGPVLAPDEHVHVRWAPPPRWVRPPEAYLLAIQAALAGSSVSSPTRGGDGSAPRPPRGRHVALLACESTQLAKEVPIDGRHRGVFSAELQHALTTLPATATYRDLLRDVEHRVRIRVTDQTPVAVAEGQPLDQPFLGGAVQPRPSTLTLAAEEGRWWIDAGAVHGIPPVRGAETTSLAILDPGAEAPAERELGEVRVVEVQATRSRVEPVGDLALDEGRTYPVVVVGVPLPPLAVELRGTAAPLDLLRSLLTTSPHVREVAVGAADEGQRVGVIADGDAFTVARADGSPLTTPLPADEAGARRTVDRLEHVARWLALKDLENPSSRLAGQVTLELVEAASGEIAPPAGERPPLLPDADGVLRRRYRRTAEGWEEPYVFAYIHNRSDRALYCTLLDLTDRYRCHDGLFPVDLVPAGRTAVAFLGEAIDLTIPDERLASGGSQVRDWLKLVAAEQRFDSAAFELPNLDVAERGTPSAPRSSSTLDRLAGRALHREAGVRPRGGAPEWVTTTVSVLTTRPVDGVELSATQDAAVDDGARDVVVIGGHPALAGASAALGTTEDATRASNARDVLPPVLTRDPAVAVPLSFTAGTAAEGALDHLELRGAIDVAAVSVEHPVELRLRVPVDACDVVLAVARDGDLFLPLGVGESDGTGWARVALHRLPEPQHEPDATRGLGRSVRIFFQRVIAARIGLDRSWPRLSLVRAVPPGEVAGRQVAELDDRPMSVSTAVENASRVLLVVHGILDDAATSVPPLVEALEGRYDVVLAFDYDAVGTGLVANATALARRLEAVGLPLDGSREIDAIGVSSGALLLRWFVEHGGGARLVRRAVLAGPPNDGTPWASAEGWAVTTLALGLNALSQVAWPAAVLAGLVGALGTLDRGIGDLRPGSAVLEALASSADACEYTVLLGDASLKRPSLDDDDGKLGRLLRRLGRSPSDLVFYRSPNDLVISVTSGSTLPPRLSPCPTVLEVPCDHLSYLRHPAALDAVRHALQ